MFMPEIAKRCARFESRSASTVSREMPERSPVIAPLAKAPASPGRAAMMLRDRCIRSRLTNSVPGSGSSHSTKGVRE